jgi:3',5'-cyclic AMP phosphodiesterase CpdA
VIRIAHLSDLHFGAHLPGLVAPLLADIADFAPDAIAVSGDLTQRAAPDEFRQAAAFLKALPAPAVCVPGNHDIPGGAVLERFADPRRRWRRFIGASTEPELLLPGAALIGLDTVRRAQPHLDWSAGGVSAARRGRLEARLDALGGRVVVVVAHHPLRHPAWAAHRAVPLGGAAAMSSLSRARVPALLAGHLHEAGRVGSAPAIIIGGSSLSHRTGGRPNSWTLVEIEGSEVRTSLRIAADGAWHAQPAARAMALPEGG